MMDVRPTMHYIEILGEHLEVIKWILTRILCSYATRTNNCSSDKV